MAISASTKITNSTGSPIKFTTISPVNDCSTWDVQPPPATEIANGQSVLISMGNSSMIPFVKGVGFNAGFVCKSNFETGSVYLDIPAVGEHQFTYGNAEPFSYATENPSGNSYTVTITLK